MCPSILPIPLLPPAIRPVFWWKCVTTQERLSEVLTCSRWWSTKRFSRCPDTNCSTHSKCFTDANRNSTGRQGLASRSCWPTLKRCWTCLGKAPTPMRVEPPPRRLLQRRSIWRSQNRQLWQTKQVERRSIKPTMERRQAPLPLSDRTLALWPCSTRRW